MCLPAQRRRITSYHNQSKTGAMADFDRMQSIIRLTGNAFDRVIFDPGLIGYSGPSIACGVIFVHAFWAGSSVKTLKRFCDSLVHVDTDRRLRFVLCDIDSFEEPVPWLYRGDSSGGNGDLFWIHNGLVVARHTANRSCDFETTNRNLLELCDTNRQRQPKP